MGYKSPVIETFKINMLIIMFTNIPELIINLVNLDFLKSIKLLIIMHAAGYAVIAQFALAVFKIACKTKINKIVIEK